MTTEAKATAEGRQALLVGLEQCDCPYPQAVNIPNCRFNYERCWWLEGYYNARIEKNCGPVLKKYGKAWP